MSARRSGFWGGLTRHKNPAPPSPELVCQHIHDVRPARDLHHLAVTPVHHAFSYIGCVHLDLEDQEDVSEVCVMGPAFVQILYRL
jgi:hypothetical protein